MLIGHFKLNGDTTDSVGTYSSNTPTAISYTSNGKLDGAAVFNGTSSSILLGSTINLAGNANWTVSVWVKTTSSARMSILSNSSGGPVMNDICIEGGKIAYYHYNAAWLFKQGTISINDGRWHNLVWVNFVGNKMNMYVDGVLDQSMVDSRQSSGPVNQIGKNWSTAYFNGAMDDLRIYNDSDLSKITDLSFTKKMIAHWPLTSDLSDYSGNSNSLVNATGTSTLVTNGKLGGAHTKTSGYYNTGITKVPDEVTISMWFRHNGTAWGGECLFGTRVGDGGFMLYRNGGDTGGYYRIYFWYNNTAGSVVGYNTWPGISGLLADTWYHITMVRNSNGNLKFYKDGIIVYDGTAPADFSSWHNNGAQLSIHSQGNGSGYTDGDISFNDIRIYNYALSEYEVKELAKSKILHYTFDDPYEEPTTNIFPRTWDTLAFRSAFNGTNYGFGTNTNLQQEFNDSLGLFDSRITKVSRINSGLSQNDYVSVDINSPANSTRVISFWYYGTYGKLIRPYNNDGSALLYYLNDLGEWIGGGIGVNIPVLEKAWQKITIKMVNRGTAGTGWSWFIMHYDVSVPTLSNTEYWAFSEFQVEDKLYPTPYTRTTRNGKVIDISGYKHTGSLSVISNSPKWVTDSKVGSGSIYFDGTNPHIISGLTNFGGLTTVTISFWRKNDTTITHWLPFVGQTTSHYIMATSSGTGGFYHYNIGSSWEIFKDGVAQGPLVAATPFTDQLWHHYVIRGVDLSAWTQFRINGYTGVWDNEGYFDDIRVYNTNLSNTDIKALYERKANLDNFGNVQVSEFIEKENLFNYINDAVESKTFISGLSSYRQANCRVTLTDQGYRIYRPANLVYPDAGTTMWGGLKIVMERPELTLQKNHKYRIMIRVKGQSSNQITPMYFSNNMGWGGGGLSPTPTEIKRIDLPANFQGEMDVLYEFSISDTIYKTCKTSYASFVAGNTYMSYRDLAFGFQYTSTGALGTDIYLTNFRLYDITNEDSLGEFNSNGIGNFDGLDEVSGTKNPAAQHEITNTGTLIINGEFSEVD